MNDEALPDILAIHADKLNKGELEANRFLQQQEPLPPETAALFALAGRLNGLLRPVQIPAPFRERLRRQLLASQEVEVSVGRRLRRHPFWMGAAAIGSLVPLLGLFIFWRRRQRSHPLPGAA